MPIRKNGDHTLWLDLDDLDEVPAVRRRFEGLGVPITILIPDHECGVTVIEPRWGDIYPKIVPRNGPGPGIIINPAQIPPNHTLLITAHTTSRPDTRSAEPVMVLSLIEGPAPSAVATIVRRDPPPSPEDPKWTLAKPPPRA